VVERMAARLNHLERKHGLHDGQSGCRKWRSYTDAVAALMNRTRQPRSRKRASGALFMDFKSVFDKVNKAHLDRRMAAFGIEPDVIR